MRSLPDIPDDPAIPALKELFPPSGVPSFVVQMAQEVAGTKLNPDAAEVSYVRYRPTRNCVVLWLFPTASGQPLLISALADDRIENLLARPSFQRSAEMVTAALGGNVHAHRHLNDRRLLLQVFPLDIRLPGLAVAGSATWASRYFRRSLSLNGDEVQIAELMPVHYKPWLRCLIRYTIQVHGRPVQYFGKVFRDDRGKPMVERLQALQRQLAACRAPWDIVTPVMYVAEARMLLLPGLEDSVEFSVLLKEALDDLQARQTLREQIARMAEGLLNFQRMAVEGLRHAGPQDVLKKHEEELEGLVQVAPALAESIRVRLRRLETLADRLPAEKVVLCHGAFRYNQFLRRGDKLTALDLDAMRLSGAGADAGEFLAYSDLTVLRRRSLQPIIPECQEVFLESVLKDERMDPRWVGWHRAAVHLKWIQRTFFSLNRRWPEIADGLLRAADTMLGNLNS